MKKFKLLLMILCVSMMFLGVLGCDGDGADNPTNTLQTSTKTVSSQVTDGGDFPAVPEPTTLILLGSGLVGLAGFGRKKFFKKDKD